MSTVLSNNVDHFIAEIRCPKLGILYLGYGAFGYRFNVSEEANFATLHQATYAVKRAARLLSRLTGEQNECIVHGIADVGGYEATASEHVV